MYKALAITFIVWGSIIYIQCTYRAYKAAQVGMTAKDFLATICSPTLTQNKCDREKAVKDYWMFMGLFLSIIPNFMLFVAFILWNS